MAGPYDVKLLNQIFKEIYSDSLITLIPHGVSLLSKSEPYIKDNILFANGKKHKFNKRTKKFLDLLPIRKIK